MPNIATAFTSSEPGAHSPTAPTSAAVLTASEFAGAVPETPMSTESTSDRALWRSSRGCCIS